MLRLARRGARAIRDNYIIPTPEIRSCQLSRCNDNVSVNVQCCHYILLYSMIIITPVAAVTRRCSFFFLPPRYERPRLFQYTHL